ncbi:response regulator transcription factor [Lacisediminihabitans changchengi]|uniref:Response regulator transcription factor n=1 Tax=Lacisediminihabitans changchengi TaxID=2787634 RepID=A0A934SS70_9MICO|nr:response regulator transcription factor [Lacisediminihabitans changchengi]MBK4346902.1 response regulator transcription factor [Lacisediminihabitans changchengi]MBK4347975.1 response regulator transcription factor [Lacisediminihabitans changchengi]
MPKILIVEDDPEMGRLIARGLTAEGHETTVVDTGVDALIALSGGDFALAAVDVMLPQMSGFEVARRIRQTGSSLPILLITARDAVEDRVFGLDSGADDYLTKPFAFVELSARVRALLRRDAAADKLVLTVGSVRLDSLAQSATAGGHPLSLSPKEFALLRLLCTHAGQTVGRAVILEEVWGTTQNIDPNIVDQYVSYLRRKLEPGAAGVQIATERGVGYRLQESG